MRDHELDPGSLLRTAERPRALTDAERHRLLRRLDGADAVTRAHESDALTTLPRPEPGDRPRRRTATSLMLAGCSLAAAAVLFVVVTMRDPSTSEPLRPVSEPAIELPTPDDDDVAFCAVHIDAVSEALVRWRGVENWAWARGEPDLGGLVDSALESAGELGHPDVAAEAAAALDRLRGQLAGVGSAPGDRDSVAPTVAAVEDAVGTLSSIASDLTPPCDTEQLAARRTANGDVSPDS